MYQGRKHGSLASPCENHSEVMMGWQGTSCFRALWHCGHYCARRRTSGSDEPRRVCVQRHILGKWRTSLLKGRGHGTRLQQLALSYHTWNGCCTSTQGANSPRNTSREDRHLLHHPLRWTTECRLFPIIGIY